MVIAPVGAPSYQAPLPLGINEFVARQLVEEFFHGEPGMDTCTIVLMRDHKIVDMFDGIWSSERY